MRVLQSSEIELVSGAGELGESFYFTTGPSLMLGYDDYKTKESAGFSYVKAILRQISATFRTDAQRQKYNLNDKTGYGIAMGLRG